MTELFDAKAYADEITSRQFLNLVQLAHERAVYEVLSDSSVSDKAGSLSEDYKETVAHLAAKRFVEILLADMTKKNDKDLERIFVQGYAYSPPDLDEAILRTIQRIMRRG